MFSFFKKKVFKQEPEIISPKDRVISQYLTNVDSMIQMLTKSNVENTEIIKESVNLVSEDNRLLGELFNTLTEPHIDVMLKSTKVTNLLLPLNNHTYTLKIKHSDMNTVDDVLSFVGDNLNHPVISRMSTKNRRMTDENFYSIVKLIKRRYEIQNSKLTVQFKKFLLKKIKEDYDILIIKYFKDVFPSTYQDIIDSFEVVEPGVLEDLYKFECLYSTKVASPYFKKLIVVPSSFNYNRARSKKYLEDLLLSHQIVITEVERV